jgi:hypothetical protein
LCENSQLRAEVRVQDIRLRNRSLLNVDVNCRNLYQRTFPVEESIERLLLPTILTIEVFKIRNKVMEVNDLVGPVQYFLGPLLFCLLESGCRNCGEPRLELDHIKHVTTLPASANI